jgi:hypothetical protein
MRQNPEPQGELSEAEKAAIRDLMDAVVYGGDNARKKS